MTISALLRAAGIAVAVMNAGAAVAELSDTAKARSLAIAANERGDYETALRRYQKLASDGDSMASYFLGKMYENGQGVVQDGAKALDWYRKSVEQGGSLAKVEIGHLYYDGLGVPQDYAEALKWFQHAADEGDVDAQYYLGLMYYNGHGMPRDYVQAYMWLNLAAARVIVLDQKNRDDYVQKRDMVTRRMTPARIAEAQKLAREWKPKWEW
jgi:TPR repeat protein